MIYHPLLYKTKMCESYLKDGICHKYGLYCAKAHQQTEIRNLVEIYGYTWKRHYDLSLRESVIDSIDTSARMLHQSPDDQVTVSSETQTAVK